MAAHGIANGVSTSRVIPFESGMPTRTLGIALSGGGNRSSPFEIGVLAGLQESGVLPMVDYLSSVSGGSYAALFFYSRLLAQWDPAPDEKILSRREMFYDCLPSKYGEDFISDNPPPQWSVTTGEGLCPDSGDQRGTYWPLVDTSGAGSDNDPLREASHLRGFQPLFDSDWSYDKYDGNVWNFKVIGQKVLPKLALGGSIDGIPNLVTNELFDWRAFNLSLTQRLYKRSIGRTYARTANNLALNPNVGLRTAGNAMNIQRLSFDMLRDFYVYSNGADCLAEHPDDGLCRTPFWIINATATTRWRFMPRKETATYVATKNGFEFTALGYGSGLYGWQAWGANKLEPRHFLSHTRLSVLDAVTASSAFLDYEQDKVGDGGILESTINATQLNLTVSWGLNIPNYYDRTPAQFLRMQIAHDILPAPLYLFHYEDEDRNDSLYIHLDDAGNTEDSGIAALLRRHVTDIIYADAAPDATYAFGDLCGLNQQLINDAENPRSIFIVLPDGPYDLLTGCLHTDKTNPFGIKDVLQHPVLRALVCKLNGKACTKETAESRLYILKPVLNLAAKTPGGISLATAVRKAQDRQLRYTDCQYSGGVGDVGYPCEVVGYMADPTTAFFPQDDIWSMGLASNAYMYGAYKELGRFYARHLSVLNGKLVVSDRW